jgi:hypothetical protein
MPEPAEYRVECFEIIHGKRGDLRVIVGVVWEAPYRGKFIESNGVFYNVRGCAELASSQLDDAIIEYYGANSGYGHGTFRIIEVVNHPAHPEPVRFRVRCEVKREYLAEEING